MIQVILGMGMVAIGLFVVFWIILYFMKRAMNSEIETWIKILQFYYDEQLKNLAKAIGEDIDNIERRLNHDGEGAVLVKSVIEENKDNSKSENAQAPKRKYRKNKKRQNIKKEVTHA